MRPDNGIAKRIVFIEPWGLGDVLQMMPCIQGCRNGISGVHLTLVLRQKSLIALIPQHLLDSVVVVEKKGLGSLFRALWSLRNDRFDIAILNSRAGVLVKYFIRVFLCASYVHGGNRGSVFRTVSKNSHQVDEVFDFIKTRFPQVRLSKPKLTISDEDESWSDDICKNRDAAIALHLGSDPGQMYKRPPPKLITPIVEFFISKGFEIFLIEGPSDRDSGEWLLERFGNKIHRISDVSLAKTAAVLQSVKLTLAGDSGIGHLSSAVGTPVITIAGPTEIHRTRPWGVQNQVVQLESKLHCQPCHGTARALMCRHKECLERISSSELLSIAWRMVQPIQAVQ